MAHIAAGGRSRPVSPVGRLPGWMQGHPAERQINAIRARQEAEEALGKAGTAMVVAFVLGNCPIAKLAEMSGIRQDEAKGMLLAYLTRLAEHLRC